jgi:hypothetical protein
VQLELCGGRQNAVVCKRRLIKNGRKLSVAIRKRKKSVSQNLKIFAEKI